MNKHSIIYIICLFVLASCKHEITLTHETCRTYKNLLKNKIICVQETELGCKSVLINPLDTASIQFRKSMQMDVTFGGNTGIYHLISFYQECVYILEDTISYCFMYQNELANMDCLYLKQAIRTPVEESYYHRRDIDTLTINESLLPIFTKDYSMLEQFSEYYDNENQ